MNVRENTNKKKTKDETNIHFLCDRQIRLILYLKILNPFRIEIEIGYIEFKLH